MTPRAVLKKIVELCNRAKVIDVLEDGTATYTQQFLKAIERAELALEDTARLTPGEKDNIQQAGHGGPDFCGTTRRKSSTSKR
jgi:ATP-dependent Zn protease